MELTMTLHPDCTAYLDGSAKWRREHGFDSWTDLDPPRARALFREGRLTRRPPLPAAARRKE